MTTSSKSQSDQLPLYVTAYQHQLYLYKLVHNFSKTYKYTFNNQTYTALVDAAAGEVFAAIYPEKFELPYVSIGGLGCVAYFLAALIPAFGLWVFNDIGLGLGLLIYLGVAVTLAIPIFIAAASVSRRF